MQQDVLDGLVEGIELGVDLRFGAEGLKTKAAVRQIRSLARLKAVKEAVKTSRDLAEFEAAVKSEQMH